MTLRTWLQVSEQTYVRQTFETLLPSDWVFRGADRLSGELAWRYALTDGFALELAVHPIFARDSCYTFQTRLYIVSEDILALEEEARIPECFTSTGQARSDRGSILSLSVERLVPMLKGRAIELSLWDSGNGLREPQHWRTLVDETIEALGNCITDIRNLPSKIFELDVLSNGKEPTPIILFGSPFVLAAEVAILLGDKQSAEEYVRSGRELSWAQTGGTPSSDALSKIDACVADKLEAHGFKFPGRRTGL